MLVARAWGVRPSALLGIEDGYAAYCLDACGAYMLARLREGKKPNFAVRGEGGRTTNARALEMLGRLSGKK